MLQAEIGSAKITAAENLPTRGHLMPDFTLSSSDGKQVSLYDYRGRANLALFFAGRAQDAGDDALQVVSKGSGASGIATASAGAEQLLIKIAVREERLG